MLLLHPFQNVGIKAIAFIREVGKMGSFLLCSLYFMFIPPYLGNRIIRQIHFIGVKTIPVIILTGLFSGMVLTLQGYYVLVTFGAESKLGSITALSLVRELGPVITALMLIGRAGSALTAEIGIMRMSEQIDALDSMALNPYQYLITPNIVAGIISMPILASMFIVAGVWGGYLVSVSLTGLSTGLYYGAIADSLARLDLTISLYKSISFGLIIAWVCCYKGFFAGCGSGFGAQGVSKATTEAVVLASVLILICDYYITSIMIFA